MNPSFEQIGFTIESTLDGSPTLRSILQGQESGESMHHSGGAASETYYIYGSVMEKIHSQFSFNASTCVVGLGLGYIEVAWAASQLKGLAPVSFENSSRHQSESCNSSQASTSADNVLHSYEINLGLQNNFKNWLKNNGSVESQTDSIYDKMLHSYLSVNQMPIQSEKVKKILQERLDRTLRLKNNFEFDVSVEDQYHIVCYDAFSKKTNESLWSYEFLNHFLKKHAHQDCVFTTYACTGVLKKTLIENGFTFIKRAGFQGKRDSTLAYRGAFTQVEWNVRTF